MTESQRQASEEYSREQRLIERTAAAIGMQLRGYHMREQAAELPGDLTALLEALEKAERRQ